MWTNRSGRIYLRTFSRVFLLLLLTLVHPSNCGLEIPITHVQVVEGSHVALPCDISLPNKSDTVLLVLWYREDLGTPIYSVDARGREFVNAERWSDERVLGTRAYFMPNKQPAELIIEKIQLEDEGVYRCRVDFKLAQTRDSKVNVTVIVPPRKIVILNEKKVEKTSVVGPYTEGASVKLVCVVSGGRPTPVVWWTRNGEASDNTSRVVPNPTRVENEVIIPHLRRADLNTELTCLASNNNKTLPLQSTVQVDMNLKPLNVVILGSNQALSANRRHDLLCESSGARPPATIKWWLDGRRLEGNKETTSQDGNTTTSTLPFTPSKEYSGKYLICEAEQSEVPGSIERLNARWQLEIQYIPETTLLLGTSLRAESIREGTDVYFDCKIQSHPNVYKVEWRHNGRPLAHNVGTGVIISNQSLVLQRVSRASAGNYTCVGFNAEGEGESEPFFLDIKYTPTCKANQSRVHGVAKLEEAKISCEVEANPPEVTFKWTFNTTAETIDVARSEFTVKGTRSIVTFTPVTEMDYGTLLCLASNDVGDQRVPCVFHIIAAGRPDPVHSCKVANQSIDSFTLYCSEGFNGGIQQHFVLEVSESKSHQLKANITSPHPRFIVSGLEPGMSFLAYVYSFNYKGRSEASVVPVFTLRLPEKQLTTDNERPRSGLKFTPTMSVLIGVAAALVIVAIVVIVVLRFQCTRENKRKAEGSSRDKANTPLKLDHGEGADSDEKNPDIIPQPNDAEEQDFMRKRQHISTIETSPARIQTPNFAGYCTLRNGMPLQDLNNIGNKPKMKAILSNNVCYIYMLKPDGVPYAQCTLPRQHWPPYSSANRQAEPPFAYPAPMDAQGNVVQPQPPPQQPPPQKQQQAQHTPRVSSVEFATPLDEDVSAETPLMVTKRESTV